jgi:glyoxylase-like metal-dependent hydrolase (beta-lactamase superfamily II)
MTKLLDEGGSVMLHRRHVLSGLAAGAVATLSPTTSWAATAPFLRKLGAIEIAVISDGVLNVPLSFAIPDAPRDPLTALLKANNLSPDGMPSPTNVTLIKTGNELVLIDAGSGSNFQPTAGKLVENMEAAGIDPASVTKVVFTHCHADHLWGVIDDLNEERFPKASYVVSPPEWDFWTRPDTVASVPDWLKPMAQAAARILKRLEGKIERRVAGEAVAHGLSYLPTYGHTPGHMAVLVESGSERLIVGGDVLSHPAVSFAEPGWRIGSDFDSDVAVRTRKSLLDQLATDKLPLIGFHLPFPGHGIVEKSGSAYRFRPV